jgi:hypothetical protein
LGVGAAEETAADEMVAVSSTTSFTAAAGSVGHSSSMLFRPDDTAEAAEVPPYRLSWGESSESMSSRGSELLPERFLELLEGFF